LQQETLYIRDVLNHVFQDTVTSADTHFFPYTTI